MNRLCVLLLIALGSIGCQSKKQDLMHNITQTACQDTQDLITSHANDVVPFVGKAIVDYAVPDAVKNGLICDCITPSLTEYVDKNLDEAALEQMMTDRKQRLKSLRKAIAQDHRRILDCYKQKGYKGYKALENLLNKLQP